SGGTASGTTFNTTGAGSEVVRSGGAERGTILMSGTSGFLAVSGGGVATNDIVETGGSIIVSSGGTAFNPLIIGGTMEVVSGGAVSGAIGFAGTGGKLKIDGTTQSAVPNATISGFISGNTIDFTNLTFSSGSASAVLNSGTDVLTITDGANVLTLQLST